MKAPMKFIYVSSVEGKLVTRYGSLEVGRVQYIGASFDGVSKVTWDTKAVTAIPESEWNKFQREYKQAVANKELTLRTEEDFAAYRKKREADEKKAADAAKAAEAKAAAGTEAAAEANKTGDQ